MVEYSFSEKFLRWSEGKENKKESSGAATDWTNVVVVTADGKTWTLFLVRWFVGGFEAATVGAAEILK